MKDSFKRSALPCLGSSLAVTAVTFFRELGTWGIGQFILNFLFTFVITTVLVSAIIWIWGKVIKKQ